MRLRTALEVSCGDGKGQCLVVYERHPAKADDTIVIAARLLRR